MATSPPHSDCHRYQSQPTSRLTGPTYKISALLPPKTTDSHRNVSPGSKSCTTKTAHGAELHRNSCQHHSGSKERSLSTGAPSACQRPWKSPNNLLSLLPRQRLWLQLGGPIVPMKILMKNSPHTHTPSENSGTMPVAKCHPSLLTPLAAGPFHQ